MRQIKAFFCDNIPTDEELQKCIKAAQNLSFKTYKVFN